MSTDRASESTPITVLTGSPRDGDAFSLPAFHRDALALGPMGLGSLRACLAE